MVSEKEPWYTNLITGLSDICVTAARHVANVGAAVRIRYVALGINMARPSQYLVDKIVTLRKVLEFFGKESGDYMRTINERLVIFLAQMDFWDWEIENLIFSFDTFDERSRAWESSGHVSSHLNKQGIVVRDKVLAELAEHNWWREQRTVRPRLVNHKTKAGRRRKGAEVIEYGPVEKVRTVAPVEELNRLIIQWNILVDTCEKRLLSRQAENMARLGADVLKNLDKFKKKERVSEPERADTGGVPPG